MKKCIGYSFWGDKTSPYFSGIYINLKSAALLYPDWDVCLFTPSGCLTPEEIKNFRNINPRFTPFELDFYPGWTGMFWRMLPIFISSYTHLCVRDLDSLLSKREADAVNEWLESNHCLHIMRDHPAHTAPIMGGMFGVKCDSKARKVFRPIKNILLNSLIRADQSYWQVDQLFLGQHVYPRYIDSMTVHDPYFEKVEFPSERSQPHHYIGRPTLKLGEDIHSSDASLIMIDEYLNQPIHAHVSKRAYK